MTIKISNRISGLKYVLILVTNGKLSFTEEMNKNILSLFVQSVKRERSNIFAS